MRPNYFLSSSFIFSAALAWKVAESDNHTWHPAGPHDSRSPCPGLNALANHGWLPHSGKDINLPAIQTATDAVYNFASDVLISIFQQVVAFNLSTTGNASTFNLEDLKKHDAIEFDGSLSRNDFYFGDDLHFDLNIWSSTAERLGLYNYKDSAGLYVTIETAAKARAARVKDAEMVNPTFNASETEINGSPGTTALYLTALWDYAVNATYKDWVKVFFEEERLPYLEGYKRPSQQTTLTSLGAMIQRVESVPV